MGSKKPMVFAACAEEYSFRLTGKNLPSAVMPGCKLLSIKNTEFVKKKHRGNACSCEEEGRLCGQTC
eukprot:1160010-Pelagomonas_calceolata.AAC.3